MTNVEFGYRIIRRIIRDLYHFADDTQAHPVILY